MQKLTRRQMILGTGAALAGVTALDAFLIETRRLEVTRHDFPIPGLSPALDGLVIAHLTDTHFYRGIHAAGRAAIDAVRAERPDVVVLIGDMCERREALGEVTEFSQAVRGSLATFATLGNWERAAGIGAREVDAAYRRAGVEFLLNQTPNLSLGGATLHVVGLDDPVLGNPILPAALGTPAPGNAAIWLVHAPAYVDQIPPHIAVAPAMILAGHTHGGQIRIPFVPPLLPSGCGRFLEGWYRDSFAPLYVSRGVGTADIRARFRCPPEVAFITLRRG
ncbi:MAG: metallophosphoesterase [Gemmatimonadales bacterium]